jgi:hypothetical protein
MHAIGRMLGFIICAESAYSAVIDASKGSHRELVLAGEQQ